ncbi:uncharacterized protein LOC118425612 isoform X2 [Branchiostoma floridae]|uniref:Uncharacterized protein LOC118425612 isoform X2 n=1 Tax=Branchiostoma floridae TaxID=7739 RepID=A0A9J7LWJ5_BRAFL|nr:uncharacterized protein LOC118425612 isoform X2 [Branchiostoma floridae]
MDTALKRSLATLRMYQSQTPSAVASKRKKEDQEMVVVANCHFLDNEDVKTTYVLMKNASFSTSFQVSKAVTEMDLKNAVSAALVSKRPHLEGCGWCFVHKDPSRRQWYQEQSNDIEKDGAWLHKMYAVRGKKDVLAITLAIIEIHVPEDTPQQQATTTSQVAQVRGRGQVSAQDSQDERDVPTSTSTSSTPGPERCQDDKHTEKARDAKERPKQEGSKEKGNDFDILKEANNTAKAMFQMSSPLDAVLQTLVAMPGLVEALANINWSDATRRNEDRLGLRAFLQVLSFTALDKLHQGLCMTELLYVCNYFEGKVDNIADMFEGCIEYLVSLDNEGDESSISHLLDVLLCGMWTERGLQDHPQSYCHRLAGKVINLPSCVNSMLKDGGRPIKFSMTEKLPNMLCFLLPEAETANFDVKVKIKTFQEDDDDMEEEGFLVYDQFYVLAAVTSSSPPTVALFPVKKEDELTIFHNGKKVSFTAETRKVAKVVKQWMQQHAPRILLYVLQNSKGLHEESLPPEIASEHTERVRRFPGLPFTSDDFALTALKRKNQALKTLKSAGQVLEKVLAEKCFTVQDDLKEVFLKYAVSHLREMVCLPSSRYNCRPPRHLIFAGPPGTGKTSFARVFGGFVNQMESNMAKEVEEAVGHVLFVDEIYQLGEGREARKALEALMNRSYEPRSRTPILILGGYLEEIRENVFKINQGFASRFPEIIKFPPMSAHQLSAILETKLTESGRACIGLDRNRLEGAILAIPIGKRARSNARLCDSVITELSSMEPDIGLSILDTFEVSFDVLLEALDRIAQKGDCHSEQDKFEELVQACSKCKLCANHKKAAKKMEQPSE